MENVFQQCVAEARDRGATVLLSSHILAETEALCERVTIIRAGRTVESGTLESMRHLSRTSIKAEMIGDPGDLARIRGVDDVSVEGHTLRAQVDGDSLGEVIKVLGDAGVRSLVSQPPTLEELFLRHYDTVAASREQVTRMSTVDATARTGRRTRRRHAAPTSREPLGCFASTFGATASSLPLWVLLLSIPLATVYVGSIEAVYPTAGGPCVFAASIMASPAQRALYGNVYGDSLGADRHLEGRHVPRADRRGGDPHGHPAHPRRRGDRPHRTHRLDRRRPLRQPDRGAAPGRGGGSIVTGVIGTAGLLTARRSRSRARWPSALALACSGSGVHRGGSRHGPAVAERTVRPRCGLRRACGGVHPAGRRRRRVARRIPVVALPAGLVAAGAPVRGRQLCGCCRCTSPSTAVLIAVAYRLLARRDVGAGLIAERPGAPRAGGTCAGSRRWRGGSTGRRRCCGPSDCVSTAC